MKTKSKQGRYGLALVTAVSVVGVAGLALVITPGAQRAAGRHTGGNVDRLELALSPAAVLQILNVSGAVAVSAWDGEKALLTITRDVARRGSATEWALSWLGSDRAEDDSGTGPSIRTNARGVQVSTLGLGGTGGAAVNYTIDVKLPRGHGLEASNGNGPITVAGVEGDVTADSENGDVRCEAITGHVSARVRNGNVMCRYVSGAIEIDAVNGTVEVEREGAGVGSPVRVWTTNGPIKFRSGSTTMSLHAQTENGRVTGGAEGPGADRVQTLHTLDLHGGEGNAEVELHALNGNIYVDGI